MLKKYSTDKRNWLKTNATTGDENGLKGQLDNPNLNE